MLPAVSGKGDSTCLARAFYMRGQCEQNRLFVLSSVAIAFSSCSVFGCNAICVGSLCWMLSISFSLSCAECHPEGCAQSLMKPAAKAKHSHLASNYNNDTPTFCGAGPIPRNASTSRSLVLVSARASPSQHQTRALNQLAAAHTFVFVLIKKTDEPDAAQPAGSGDVKNNDQKRHKAPTARTKPRNSDPKPFPV